MLSILAIAAMLPAYAYGYTSAAQSDQIDSLPGMAAPAGFNMFSGYLPVSDTKSKLNERRKGFFCAYAEEVAVLRQSRLFWTPEESRPC